MRTLGLIIVGLVAVLHLGFLVLEMFYWDHEIGRKIFNMTPEVSAGSKVLAMNQGLYNGFLAAGLLYGVVKKNFDFIFFFLGCVMLAGVFGAATAKFSILFTQALPALIAFILLMVSKSANTPD